MRKFLAFFYIFLLFFTVFAEANKEIRAIWFTRFEWAVPNSEKCKENIINGMKEIADANFNLVFFQIRGAAEALYRSPYEVWSPLLDGKDPGFDPLEFAIKEAHKRGLSLHAYVNVYTLVLNKYAPPMNKNHLFYKHGPNTSDPWICIDENGKIMDVKKAGYYYLSPGIPQVQAYLRKVICDIVKRYDVDGIHLDRVRYPGPNYSHDSISEKRFIGRGNPENLDWCDWEREQVTKFVNDLYAQIKLIKKNVQLTSAVWGIYSRYHIKGYEDFSSGYHDYYQDSWKWIKIGAMDYIVPMIYWNIPDPKPNYDELLQDFINGVGKDNVIGGQRLYGKWDPLENIAEIAISRELGIIGTCWFSYSSAKSKKAFSMIKESLYKEKSSLPQPKLNGGIICGYVYDKDGNPICDAWVKLKPVKFSDNEIFSKIWTTSADGFFAFLKVPSVEFKVIIEYPYFDKKELGPFKLGKDEIKQIEVKLNVSKKDISLPFFKILNPITNKVTSEYINILGRTRVGNKVFINGEEVKVFPTGAFAKDKIKLMPGKNPIDIKVVSPEGKVFEKTFIYTREFVKKKRMN